MTREIILDTETTGLDPLQGHRIIEVGALVMENKILTGEKFHYYVNPERDVPSEAYRVHGIAGEFLKDKPLFSEIADEFIDFISDSKLVIHNAPFDIKFLNYELGLLDMSAIAMSNTIDTLIIARKSFPGSRVNLDALCKRFKVDNSSRAFHGALKDAALLAEVYVELTGGRQASFSLKDKDKPDYDTNTKIDVAGNLSGNKLVIYPNSEELARHKDFIKKILN